PRWARACEVVKGLSPGADWRAGVTRVGYTRLRRKQGGGLGRLDRRPSIGVRPEHGATQVARLHREGPSTSQKPGNDRRADVAPSGTVAGGARPRLLHAAPARGSSTARYLDLHAATLQDDDRPFLAVLSPDYLAGDGFADLVDDARRFGAELRLRLDDTL